MQIDEATDCSGTSHLTAYVRYVEDTTMNEAFIPQINKKKTKNKRTLLNC
jgi:hypothetical protein